MKTVFIFWSNRVLLPGYPKGWPYLAPLCSSKFLSVNWLGEAQMCRLLRPDSQQTLYFLVPSLSRLCISLFSGGPLGLDLKKNEAGSSILRPPKKEKEVTSTDHRYVSVWIRVVNGYGRLDLVHISKTP